MVDCLWRKKLGAPKALPFWESGIPIFLGSGNWCHQVKKTPQRPVQSSRVQQPDRWHCNLLDYDAAMKWRSKYRESPLWIEKKMPTTDQVNLCRYQLCKMMPLLKWRKESCIKGIGDCPNINAVPQCQNLTKGMSNDRDKWFILFPVDKGLLVPKFLVVF